MKRCLYLSIYVILVTAIFISPCLGQKLDIEVKTKSYGGIHAPENIAAIWIQTQGDELIKTLIVCGPPILDLHQFLKYWRTITGLIDTGYYDGVTSATRENHNDIIEVSWDCKDTSGNLVPTGSYEFWVEMTETEYWWLTGEEYPGRYAKGSIVIDNNPKVAYGDTSDTCFSNFKATYDPTVEIMVQGPNPAKKKPISYWYNPVMQKLTIKLNSLYDNSAVLHIINLKGELIETVEIDTKSSEFYWDLRDRSGRKVSSGVYVFEVRSADTGKRIGNACSITLLW